MSNFGGYNGKLYPLFPKPRQSSASPQPQPILRPQGLSTFIVPADAGGCKGGMTTSSGVPENQGKKCDWYPKTGNVKTQFCNYCHTTTTSSESFANQYLDTTYSTRTAQQGMTEKKRQPGCEGNSAHYNRGGKYECLRYKRDDGKIVCRFCHRKMKPEGDEVEDGGGRRKSKDAEKRDE